MNNIAKPLFFGAFVALFSSFFFAIEEKQESTPKPTIRTRDVSVQDSAGISTIQLRGPSSFLEVKTTYEIGKTDHISFQQQINASDINTFDIQHAKLERNGDTLMLTIAPEDELPHFVDTVLTIKLPNRDWTIDQAVEFSSMDDAPIIKQAGEPINLTVIDETPRIHGRFKELVIWQPYAARYDRLFLSNQLKAKRVEVFAESVNLASEEGESAIGQMVLHSGRKGFVITEDLQLLNKTRWQELTAEEKSQLAVYQALNEHKTEAPATEATEEQN